MKKTMADPTFINWFADWINVVYLIALSVTLATSVLAVLLSHRRTSALQAELQKVRAESTRPSPGREVNRDFQSQPSPQAAESVDRDELSRKNVELSIQLEKERRLRLEAEARLGRQSTSEADVQEPDGARLLTTAQEHALFLRLRRYEGNRVFVTELADNEAGQLARQISAALGKASWNVTVSRVGSLTPSQFGIICTHGSSDEAARLLIDTLRSFNLTVYERSGSGPLEILIGLKPL